VNLMREKMALALVLLTQVSHAESLIAPAQRAALYQACEAAIHGKSRAEALAVLEYVVEDQPDHVIQEAGRRAGLQAYFTDQVPFHYSGTYLREYALELIGRTGLQEAIEYLSTLTPEKIGVDNSQRLYPKSKLALQRAFFSRETGPLQQIAFLERELTSPTNAYTAQWAQDELCNRGSAGSMELVTQFIKRLNPLPAGDEEVEFCRTRIDIVNRDPNRAKALGSALRVDATRQDETIVRWAMSQLFEMESAEAQAVLDRYATEVEARFPDVPGVVSTPERHMHRALAQEIRRKVPRSRAG